MLAFTGFLTKKKAWRHSKTELEDSPNFKIRSLEISGHPGICFWAKVGIFWVKNATINDDVIIKESFYSSYKINLRVICGEAVTK